MPDPNDPKGPPDKPGELLTIAREGMTQQQFQDALTRAVSDGWDRRVVVLYRDAKK